MVDHNRDRHSGEAATDRPARGSKWIWIVGAFFLLVIVVLLIRGMVYAAADDGSAEGGVLDSTETDAVATNQAR